MLRLRITHAFIIFLALLGFGLSFDVWWMWLIIGVCTLLMAGVLLSQRGNSR